MAVGWVEGTEGSCVRLGMFLHLIHPVSSNLLSDVSIMPFHTLWSKITCLISSQKCFEMVKSTTLRLIILTPAQ